MNIFISSPYSKPASPQYYVDYAVWYYRQLVLQNHTPVAPMIAAHYALTQSQQEYTQQEYDKWLDHCLGFLDHSIEEVHVLMHPGWECSNGVQTEIRISKDKSIPVKYIEVQDDGFSFADA